MKQALLFAVLLPLAVSAKAGALGALESASAGIDMNIGDIAVPQVPAPARVDLDKGLFEDIIDYIPFLRTYRLGPLFKLEADALLDTVVARFENAGAKVQTPRVEGGWRDSFVIVDYKAHFRVKQYRRDNIPNVLYAHYLLNKITEELPRHEAHIIYSRVEGVIFGSSSVIIDYAGGKGDMKPVIDAIIGDTARETR